MVEQDVPDVAPGWTLGVSVSESEDLARFGVTETHFRMALAEVARAVLLAEGRLVYGGHLDAEGYTSFLTNEVQRFGSRDRPFTGYIPFSVHRRMTSAEIQAHVADLSLLGRYVFLDADGNTIDPIDGRSDEPEPVDEDTERRALTAARQVISASIDGQLVVGGKRSGFRGRMPGVIEEVILTMRAGKPIFIAGGFGGAAADMAAVLNLDPERWLRLEPPDNPALAELRSIAEHIGWEPTSNGLTTEENLQLAVTYRASEVAHLVITGLSRLTT